MANAFQKIAFQKDAFQQEFFDLAFQPCGFQYDAFQTIECPTAHLAFQPCGFQYDAFQTIPCPIPPIKKPVYSGGSGRDDLNHRIRLDDEIVLQIILQCATTVLGNQGVTLNVIRSQM